MFSRIVVLCTGNICRSPMAEALLRNGLPTDYDVRSAGVSALVGHSADPLAQAVMRDRDADISGHRARQATIAMLSACDLILSLDQTHSDWVNSQFPQLRGRVHKLGKWSGNIDIRDPYMGPVSAFEQAYADIDSAVAQWLPHLQGTKTKARL